MSKFCEYCGAKMNDTARFCVSCGKSIAPEADSVGGTTKTADAPAAYCQAVADEKASPAHSADYSANRGAVPPTESSGFTPDADGKYHWYYELNLFTNPTAFITVCKVFGGIIIGCGLLIGLLSQQEFLDTIKFILSIWLWGFGGFLVIGGISYVIYAIAQGGKYCVVFEMDEKSVVHIQLAKQVQKAQVIGALAALAGALQGSLTLMGTGILAGSRAIMETEFKMVDKIKVKRRRSTIYLHAALAWNHIYATPENFDEVLAYIQAHIPTTAKRIGI